jgi:hypothetical protein
MQGFPVNRIKSRTQPVEDHRQQGMHPSKRIVWGKKLSAARIFGIFLLAYAL